MKHGIIGLLVGLILGAAGGFAAGIFIFPYLFPPPEVNEAVVGRGEAEVVARGEFIHANPSDPIHYGRGQASVYADLVHLETDFEVGPGPKYHVYLVPLGEVTPDTAVHQSMYVDLGRLKSFRGSQNYPIPPGVTLTDYPYLVVWCEQFNVLISPAKLNYHASN